jgi:ketosteroid isomerase-like protein
MTGKSERLRQAMEAVTSGDAEGFADTLLADDVVWHWPGRSSVSGDYRGRDEVIGLVRGFHELTRNTLRIEPLDILEGRDYLMSFTRATAEHDGRSLDVVMADAMRFGADGRVEEFWTLSNDQEAVDSFIG